MFAFVFLFAVVEKTFGPKEEFATYRNEIAVIDSQFSQRSANTNLMVTVVGTLTNNSAISWKDVGVEAQFFDKSGKLIDVIKVNADNYSGVTILPHGIAAFKIEGRAAHPAADYYTNELNVRWAKDVDAFFSLCPRSKITIATPHFSAIFSVPFARVGIGKTAFNFRARVGMERP